MKLEDQAKVEVVEEITKLTTEKGGDGMATFAMGMQAVMVIEMYNDKLNEKLGGLGTLLTALESGGFTDESGSKLTDTITFQTLKKRLSDDG